MDFVVTPKEIVASVPHLTEVDPTNLEAWIHDAIAEVEVAFARRNRDFNRELETTTWLEPVARRVVRDVVSAVALVGPNVGMRSASSTTGPQADSVTYADVDSVGWGGVRLTPQQLLDLGLVDGLPRGNFGPRLTWPERRGWPIVSRRARRDR